MSISFAVLEIIEGREHLMTYHDFYFSCCVEGFYVVFFLLASHLPEVVDELDLLLL